jgi:hypothetical protein
MKQNVRRIFLYCILWKYTIHLKKHRLLKQQQYYLVAKWKLAFLHLLILILWLTLSVITLKKVFYYCKDTQSPSTQINKKQGNPRKFTDYSCLGLNRDISVLWSLSLQLLSRIHQLHQPFLDTAVCYTRSSFGDKITCQTTNAG